MAALRNAGARLPTAYGLCVWLLFGVANARGGNGGGRVFTFVNKCSEPVWVGTQGNVLLQGGGWELKAGGVKEVVAPGGWQGRFWGRTGCRFDGKGRGKCETGDCGGAAKCAGRGGQPPATLAEFTVGKTDFYDVSLVDGYNLEVSVVARGGRSGAAGGGACRVAGCDADVNEVCPAELRVSAGRGGGVVACRSACNAFAQPRYCCTGPYATPQTCRASNFSLFFKRFCPRAYTYAFDDPSSMFTCTSPRSYLVIFCR